MISSRSQFSNFCSSLTEEFKVGITSWLSLLSNNFPPSPRQFRMMNWLLGGRRKENWQVERGRVLPASSCHKTIMIELFFYLNRLFYWPACSIVRAITLKWKQKSARDRARFNVPMIDLKVENGVSGFGFFWGKAKSLKILFALRELFLLIFNYPRKKAILQAWRASVLNKVPAKKKTKTLETDYLIAYFSSFFWIQSNYVLSNLYRKNIESIMLANMVRTSAKENLFFSSASAFRKRTSEAIKMCFENSSSLNISYASNS